MSSNYLKVRDVVKFSLTDKALIQIKDDYEGAFRPPAQGQQHPSGMGTQDTSMQQTAAGLLVRIAATHSGIITRNNGFYLPDKMSRGASSFTDNYQKPVLVHHKDHEDNIGRIVGAEYLDTSGAIRDHFNLVKGLIVKDRKGKEKGVITDILLQDFCEGKMPFGMQVDTVASLFRDSLLEDSDYQGLGHIQILANIVDRKSVEKLLDGRYLTGSVGATTDAAVCSVCRQDWTEAGKCDHRPGAIYDGAKCFIIAGNLTYDEYSFVNVPADRHSRVLELHYNGIQDSVEIANDYPGRIYEVRLGFPQYDSAAKEEDGMSKKKVDASQEDPKVDIKDSVSDPTTPESAEATKTEETQGQRSAEDVQDQTTDNVSEEDPQAVAGDATVTDATSNKDEQVTSEGEEPDAVTAFFDATGLTEEEMQKFYDEVYWPEVEAAFADGEFTLEQLEVENLEDAKLSSEKRKKLAGSTFCGPGRSFPVPDCAHVTAARRLIGRYKGGGDKSKILACVSRKAKAMGCGDDSSKSKDAVQKTVVTQTDDNMNAARIMHMVIATLEENQYSGDKAPLEDAEKQMLRGILKRLATMVGKDAVLDALVTEELILDPVCEQALLDEVEKNETTIGKLRDQVAAIRKEYTDLYKDMETLQDELAEANASTRKAQEAHLSTLVNLQESKVEDRDFSELSTQDLTTRVEDAVKSVDMNKITDKLGDGMAREPTGEVDNPNAIQDQKVQKSSDVQLTDKMAEQIQEHWYKLLFSQGKLAADAYVKRLQAEGIIPLDSETN